jgi:hypothetical protein
MGKTTNADGRSEPRPAVAEAWHRIVTSRDATMLSGPPSDAVVFRSPAVHAPQEGRQQATAYLSAALEVLCPALVYERQWAGERSAVLEFRATVDGLDAHGIDTLQCDDNGKLTEFTVMLRPLKALHRLVGRMGEQLQVIR